MRRVLFFLIALAAIVAVAGPMGVGPPGTAGSPLEMVAILAPADIAAPPTNTNIVLISARITAALPSTVYASAPRGQELVSGNRKEVAAISAYTKPRAGATSAYLTHGTSPRPGAAATAPMFMTERPVRV